jgi:hypothetical protein
VTGKYLTDAKRTRKQVQNADYPVSISRNVSGLDLDLKKFVIIKDYAAMIRFGVIYRDTKCRSTGLLVGISFKPFEVVFTVL